MSDHHLKDQYIQVGKIKTRYWALGEGETTVILLHGIGCYIENWQENMAALGQGRRVYALDLPGFGRSDKPQISYSYHYFVEFVKEFMAVQNVDKAVFIGESMGGGIALLFALKYPHQVEKMVLADSAGMGREVAISLRLLTIPILGELLARPSRTGAIQALRQIFYKQALITDQMIEEAFEISLLPGAQRCFLSMLRSGCNIFGGKRDAYHAVLDRLEELRMPALIIWGAQDRLLPVAHAHIAAQRLPNAKLHIFEQCGHMPNIECAEEFNTLVIDFLSGG